MLLQGAYVERVVVNLMAGQGETEVFLDDLEVGPVSKELAAAWAANGSPAVPDAAQTKAGTTDRAEKAPGRSDLPPFKFERNVFDKLTPDRRYLGWFPTAIEAPGADAVALRQAGFDVLVTDANPDPEKLRRAVKAGMFLLPRLTGATQDGGVERVLQQITNYPLPQSVLLWSIADHLGSDREAAAPGRRLNKVRDVLAAVHEGDERHLATATVEGEYRLYARSPSNLDVIGIDLPVWGSSLSLSDGLMYLKQRRDLSARSNPEAMFWAWLPAITPQTVVRNIWGSDDVPPWGTPPVQPEQLRLMTYMALAGGCRGLSFLGDADLTRPAGEPLLLEMNFLNAEIDLFEEVMAHNVKRIGEYKVFDPDPAERPTTANVNMKRMPLISEQTGKAWLHAATIPLAESRGALLLVADFNGEAQWQPPQMAYHDLVINARLPQGVQFLVVSPGEARFLEQKVNDRIPGGTRLTVPDFGTTAMILCTTDMALCRRIEGYVQRIRPRAAQMAIRQAELQLAAVRETQERLHDDGHLIISEDDIKKRRKRGIDTRPPDAEKLLAEAEKFIKNARVAQEAQDYGTAWAEARRAGRPLRHVMFGYWQLGLTDFRKAVEESINGKKIEYKPGEVRPYPKPPVIVTASSCPPAISFYTLPEMHIWKDWVKGIEGFRFGPNRVPSGSFDEPAAVLSAGWTDVSHQYEHIVKKITVPKKPHGPEPKKKKERPKKETIRSLRENIQYEPEYVAETDHVLMLSVTPDDPKDIDKLEPYFDFPAAAVLSPAVRVEANNLIRISVLFKRPLYSTPGRGGVIIRDSIGGEQFQYRSHDTVAGYSRVVLYRKAPADCTFRVMLGLAGYGEVHFDDFRVEVIEADVPHRSVAPDLAQDRQRPGNGPRLPDPRVPEEAAARTAPVRRQR